MLPSSCKTLRQSFISKAGKLVDVWARTLTMLCMSRSLSTDEQCLTLPWLSCVAFMKWVPICSGGFLYSLEAHLDQSIVQRPDWL